MRSESSDHHEKEIITQLRKSNYYEILNLKSGASEEDIKKSFKKMALKYHPDKNSASSSKEVFHKITEAYDTLSDPSKRVIYDEKQIKVNKNTMEFNFSRPSNFFERTEEFSSKFTHKYAEFKMNENARKERDFLRKQNEEKEKEKKRQWNEFFKNKNDLNTSKQNQFSSDEEKKEKASWQNTFNNFTKQREFFTFQKVSSKKNCSFSSGYEEVRKEKERKESLQKQKEKADKNIREFMIFVLIVVAWLIFSQFGSTMKGIPVYSMQPTEAHKIEKFTKELRSPFYVTEEYVERISADDKFREYLDRKIDKFYIKALSRVCNTMMKKEYELNYNLGIVKSRKSKEELHNKIQNLDLTPCQKLHDARELNPVYFKELFSEQKGKELL